MKNTSSVGNTAGLVPDSLSPANSHQDSLRLPLYGASSCCARLSLLPDEESLPLLALAPMYVPHRPSRRNTKLPISRRVPRLAHGTLAPLLLVRAFWKLPEAGSSEWSKRFCNDGNATMKSRKGKPTDTLVASGAGVEALQHCCAAAPHSQNAMSRSLNSVLKVRLAPGATTGPKGA